METPRALESDRRECASLLSRLLAMWPRASHSTSLTWSFSIKLR